MNTTQQNAKPQPPPQPVIQCAMSLLDIRAEIRAKLEAQRSKIAPPSGNRISTKGKVFTLPDGKTSPGPIYVLIVDWRITHQYFTGIYDPKNIQPPVCWSIGNEIAAVPSPKVREVKSATCTTCAFNQFGSASTGRGKACKEGRRLAVVPVDATNESDIWILDVSPTGIQAFDGYVSRLQDSANLHPSEVVTSVAFKPSEAYPTLIFGNPTPLDDEALAIVYGLSAAANTALDREPSIDQ